MKGNRITKHGKAVTLRQRQRQIDREKDSEIERKGERGRQYKRQQAINMKNIDERERKRKATNNKT